MFWRCVNLPRWGLKLALIVSSQPRIPSVNLPRWGLKRIKATRYSLRFWRVNLPRWGLKLLAHTDYVHQFPGVNLPRWGLKRFIYFYSFAYRLCKFTPLGFETLKQGRPRR